MTMMIVMMTGITLTRLLLVGCLDSTLTEPLLCTSPFTAASATTSSWTTWRVKVTRSASTSASIARSTTAALRRLPVSSAEAQGVGRVTSASWAAPTITQAASSTTTNRFGNIYNLKPDMIYVRVTFLAMTSGITRMPGWSVECLDSEQEERQPRRMHISEPTAPTSLWTMLTVRGMKRTSGTVPSLQTTTVPPQRLLGSSVVRNLTSHQAYLPTVRQL